MVILTKENWSHIFNVPDNERWLLTYEYTDDEHCDAILLQLGVEGKDLLEDIDMYYNVEGYCDAFGRVLLEKLYNQIEDGKKTIITPTREEILKEVKQRELEELNLNEEKEKLEIE